MIKVNVLFIMRGTGPGTNSFVQLDHVVSYSDEHTNERPSEQYVIGLRPPKPIDPAPAASPYSDNLDAIFYPNWTDKHPAHNTSSRPIELPKVKNPNHHTTFEHCRDLLSLFLDIALWISLATMRVLSVRLLLFHLSEALVAGSEALGLYDTWLCPSCIESTLSWTSVLVAAITGIFVVPTTLRPVILGTESLRFVNILFAGSLVLWLVFVLLCVSFLGKLKSSLKGDDWI